MLRALPVRLRHPHTTVRWRLTLLYGGLFLVCGAALLAITYTLVSHAQGTPAPAGVSFIRALPNRRGFGAAVQASGTVAGPCALPACPAKKSGTVATGPLKRPPLQLQVPDRAPPQVKKLLRSAAGTDVVRYIGQGQRTSDLHQLEVWSAIALAIMSIISGALGWLVAGRVLRPLRTITTTAQEISEANLHERLAMRGPRDELRKLADTIDGLLERLEGAFDAQRRFVANASHELRTPLTAARAVLEMTLSDPHATIATFRDTCKQALEENEQQEQLIDALLALAQGQRGVDQREPIELAELVGEVMRSHELDAAAQGLRVDVALAPVVIAGDPRLVARLISNLVDNAIRHNMPAGRLDVSLTAQASQAVLAISNTGELVPAEEVERLLQPFQRLTPDRLRHRDGLGLGLSIVAAIAATHDAALDIRPGEHGGLRVEVRFPVAEPAYGAPARVRQSAPRRAPSPAA